MDPSKITRRIHRQESPLDEHGDGEQHRVLLVGAPRMTDPVRAVLNEHRYVIDAAADSPAALKILGGGGDPFSLILVFIPKPPGKESVKDSRPSSRRFRTAPRETAERSR